MRRKFNRLKDPWPGRNIVPGVMHAYMDVDLTAAFVVRLPIERLEENPLPTPEQATFDEQTAETEKGSPKYLRFYMTSAEMREAATDLLALADEVDERYDERSKLMVEE